ncbi:MAG: carotenoid biosynthesis protein [Acidimicrobiales bacterium]|nr:carotenoid biosynthesis protein [Acidimicrobiales bacterium]
MSAVVTGGGAAAARGLAGVSLAVAAASMVATPLRRRGRRGPLADAVVAGLAGTSLGLAAERWGWPRAGTAAGGVALATLAVEVVGSRTGVPFGRYGYTGELRPTVGGVPAVVPLAWFALGLPARDVGARLAPRSAAGRVVLGAAALTAWDLFLDPQMTAERYWVWPGGGPYRDIPLSNYAGWLAVSAGVMALLDRLLPTDGSPPDDRLLGLYTWMAAMSTLGFAVFFRDPLVAAVGGLGMGVPAALAWNRRRRSARG